MEENKTNEGISLLKIGKKGLIHMIFSRFGIILLLLVIQILFLFGLFFKFRQLAPHYIGISTVFYVLMIVAVVNSDNDPTAKITWLVVMVIMPIFGGLLYLFMQFEIGHKALKKRLSKIIDETKNELVQNEKTIACVEESNPELSDLHYYINNSGCFPVYQNDDVKYFPLGEKMFEDMLVELEKAEKFIFMEYFILDEGMMWGKILEILARKAKEGVEVRVMYDGTCEFNLLPTSYPKKLADLGISCKVFAPFKPFVSTHYNYRDHRKIMVIDGKVAYNGGVNIADEYINHIIKHGHWKDTAIKIKGAGVNSFTLMFLQMWHVSEDIKDLDKYYVEHEEGDGKSFILPYGDCPLDSYDVGESVYMDILNKAHDYAYIMSPYLILDGELEKALAFAAQRSVDVRIILPSINDSFVAKAMAKTYYKSLIKAGVKIYEYLPGFDHGKMFISDDCRAVVGTINLDYRSLYHHFECATYLSNTSCIKDIKDDFLDTFQKCKEYSLEDVKKEKWYLKLIGNLLKFIAPLL